MTDTHAMFAEAVAQLGRPRTATYRFQLGQALGFDHVTGLAPYLEALGVTDAYL
jgi:maltooligosyltrehalose synthase